MSNKQFRYTYDSSVKWTCPSCKEKKRFVRYRDVYEKDETKCWVDYPYGYCDRIESCGHNTMINMDSEIKNEIINPDSTHFHLFTIEHSLFNPNSLDVSWYKPIKDNAYLIEDLQADEQMRVLGGYYSETVKLMDEGEFGFKNNFVRSLVKKFGKGAIKAAKEYKLMTFLDGGVVFPYFNFFGNLINGKIMFYGDDLKRIRAGKQSHIQWLHNCHYKGDLMNYDEDVEDYKYSLSFFGYDFKVLDEYSVVGIVESEKTAIIMAILFPEIRWLASGSVLAIQSYKFAIGFENKIILLFPDLGYLKQKKQSIPDFWFDTIQKNIRENCDFTDVILVNFLPNYYYEEDLKKWKNQGYDVADFIIGHGDPYIEEIKKRIKNLLSKHNFY